jgi:hypothetical protein
MSVRRRAVALRVERQLAGPFPPAHLKDFAERPTRLGRYVRWRKKRGQDWLTLRQLRRDALREVMARIEVFEATHVST